MINFSKRVQVLFLVSLCFTTFCRAHRTLSEEPQVNQSAAAGETMKPVAGNINAFGATRCCCGFHQPHWVYPQPNCGGGGCGGSGGGSTEFGGGGCCGPSCSGGCCGGSAGSSTDVGCGDFGGGVSNGGCGCCHPVPPPPMNCHPGCCNWPKPTQGMGRMDQVRPNHEKQDSEPKSMSEVQRMNNGPTHPH